MDPFLPWPGSKAKCAQEIVSEFPRTCKTYREPFLGSGAVYFALNGKLGFLKVDFEDAALSDVNEKLIGCWQAVRDKPEEVIALLERHLAKNSEEYYGQMRRCMWSPAAFIYVMRAAFSSMYRENLKGEFNVPWRKQDFEKNNRKIAYKTSQITECSRYMAKRPTGLTARDWIGAVGDTREGDLVYFDPPYLPYSETGFTDYSSSGFGAGDHVMLSNACKRLQARGATVVLSNSDTEASRRIYGPPTRVLSVANAVNAKATIKGKRAEGLWIYRP